MPSNVTVRAHPTGVGCPTSVALFSCSKLALISRSVPLVELSGLRPPAAARWMGGLRGFAFGLAWRVGRQRSRGRPTGGSSSRDWRGLRQTPFSPRRMAGCWAARRSSSGCDRWLSEPRNQDEVPAARQLASLDAAIVLAEVARYYGVDQDCFQVRRSGLLGRDLAAWLVRHHSSATLRELAPIFGLNHPDSVNHLVRRVDLALARSSELRENIGMTQRILEQRRHGSS